MKKTLLFACLLLLGATCAQALTSYKIGDLNYTLNETDKTATVAYTSGATGDIVIPASVTYNETEYAVVGIASNALYYTKITSVVIPSSVKSISGMAFYSCSSLTSVTIEGEALTSIGDKAFADCSALTTINIPNSVTSFGDNILKNCTNLTAPVYNATNFICMPTSYEGDYTIPDGITTIFGSAFDGCNKLTSVTIPNSVTTIGREAFYDCSKLTSVTIPEGVTTIGAWTFCNCKLTSVTIPNSVTTIGGYAFYRCNKLTSVTLSSNLTSIGESAFYGCSSLTSANIPASVTSIGNSAFGSCSALETITVESGNTVYDGRDNCNAIIETKTNTLVQGCKNSTIPASVQIIGAGAFAGCRFTATITIPSTVTTIGSSAFNSASLTSITIPASVTSIGKSAFGWCNSLETITVESGNTVYDSRNNCNALIETKTNTLINGCKNTTIPDGVVAIGPNAFDGLRELTSITIPASVTTIGAYAFRNCQQLASIEIPNGVTTIGDWAFNTCALTNLTIPASVTTIGQSAFNNCWILKSIAVKWQEPLKCGSDAFQSVSSSATLCVPCGTSEKYKAADPWSKFSSNVTEQAYSIIAQTNDGSKGTVVVTQQPTCENNQAIIAVGTTYCNDKCYDFLGWSDGVKDRERTITVTRDTVITGIFGFDQYEVTTKCEPAEGGTVTPGGTYEKYTKITLEATANAGYHFVYWNGGLTTAKIEDEEVKGNQTHIAYFELNTYTLSEGTITEGGTVGHATEAKYGETVKIYVYPNVGYKLGSLTVMDADNNKKVEVSADYKFTMPAGNVTVSATFVEDAYDITITQPVGGTVEASKTTAKENDEITLTITLDTGYELDNISVKDADGNYKNVSDDHKFNMPNSNVTVTVTFKKISYDIKYNEMKNGDVVAEISSGFNHGFINDEVKINIYPSEGYELDEISAKDANGNDVTISEDHKFTMPAAEVTITATFKKITYAITVGQLENGKVEINKTEAQIGDEVTITITPDEGYRFDVVWLEYDGAKFYNVVKDNKFTVPAYDVTIYANFVAILYDITYSSEHGNVWSTSTGAHMGDEIALLIESEAGYELDKITVTYGDGQEVEVSAENTFVMPAANVTVTGTFKKIGYVININKSENGTVEADKDKAQMGDEVILTIKPDEGFELDKITVTYGDGQEVEVSAENTFVMPAAEVTVTASFKALTALQNTEMPEIYAENGRIYGADDMQIFTIVGQNVTEMNGQLSGVYVVKVGNVAQKVIVR